MASLIGFVIGFVTSVPVAGPISVLVFGRGLQGHTRSGVYLAIGSAIPESVYAFLAFWGFSELLSAYPWIEPLTGGVAAVILLSLGIRFVRRTSERQVSSTADDDGPAAFGNKRSFLLGLTIAALNPTLLATWPVMVTAAHSLGVLEFGTSRALPFSVGVTLGISSWFVVLLWLLSRFKDRFRRATLDQALRVVGVVLSITGLAAGARFVIFVLDVVILPSS